jgi:hypothetical protein
MAVTMTEAHYEILRRSIIKIANGRHRDKRLSREEIVTTARVACDTLGWRYDAGSVPDESSPHS